MSEKKTLAELLDNEQDVMEEVEPAKRDDTLCNDCQRMPKELYCKDCDESFCRVCFQFVHRGGKRKAHTVDVLVEEPEAVQEAAAEVEDEKIGEENEIGEYRSQNSSVEEKIMAGIKRSAKFVPTRLSYEERQLLKLLEAALEVSEYTDKVDILSYKSKSKRIIQQLREICSILAGLVVSSNMKVGQRLIADKTFADNAVWYKRVFEIGRRYKVMNPERMRDTFGKLCYMVMDSMLPEVREAMEFDLYKPVKTVQSVLTKAGGLKLLDDPLIIDATAEVRSEGRSRRSINRMIRQKESAIERLASKYATATLEKETIRTVLYSIGDFNAYTNKNRLPAIRMLKRLDSFKEPTSKYSLGIKYGQNGARLSHNHEKQYLYVKQALALWSVVMRDLVELWAYADDDLFDGNRYHLADTGQGLNRIKSCPKVYKKMYSILGEVQHQFDYWVGIPVIHLGDDAVPNALFFLDKYIQIPSILIPIDDTVRQIPAKAESDHYLLDYIKAQYGTVEDLQLTILCDYFKHGFDGSGADNYYFAGSCVDATSTSSCEFCNRVPKKPYYNFFLLSGHTNFNGEGY